MAAEKDNQSEPDATAQTPSASGHTALLRKAQVGLAEHQTKAMSLAKALRLSVAKVADKEFDLAMAALSIKIEERGNDDLSEVFDDNALLILLDGTARRRGAVIIDQAFVGALIQQQTMGNVLAVPEGEGRQMTPTDASICAPFLENLLAMSCAMPDHAADRDCLTGYRFGAQADDTRLLGMALDAQDYKVIHMTLDVASGVRQGKLIFCLPLPVQSDLSLTDDAGDAPEESLAPPKTLRGNVMGLHVDLNIALARLSLPLKKMSDLKVGQCLDIGVPRFDDVRVLTPAGRSLSKGILGQLDGARAVQVQVKKPLFGPPKRRAGDVAPADLSGSEAEMPSQMPDFGDLMAAMDAAPPEPELPDLPDMSDLPDLEDLPELPEID